METGPRTPKETSSTSLAFLNANTCPNARTSSHCSHTFWNTRFFCFCSSFGKVFKYVLKRSDNDFAPSSERSSDCTKIVSPASCRRLRIFLFSATSETSPSPSDVVRGRLPFNGSPLGLALLDAKTTAKSILFSKAAMI